eukprot:TRINITY_DN8690_c0_g1_i3.p1 TRINITY_DN8690_c0_g1~~TRINITY_DN8690_c0_g1_i3.p1  ORF type:complete len:447 (+),score=83.83 TRINITY_DN8690_c0_g1_i3:44-1384(+)
MPTLRPVPAPEGGGKVTWVAVGGNGEPAAPPAETPHQVPGVPGALEGYAPAMPDVAVALSLSDWGALPRQGERGKKRVRLPAADPRDEDGRRRFVLLESGDVDAALARASPRSAPQRRSPARIGAVHERPFKHHPIIPPMPPGMTYDRGPAQLSPLTAFAPSAASEPPARPASLVSGSDLLEQLCNPPPTRSLSPSHQSPALLEARDSPVHPIAPPQLLHDGPSGARGGPTPHPLHPYGSPPPPAVHVPLTHSALGKRDRRTRNRNIEPYGLPLTMLAQLCPHMAEDYLLVDVESAERLHYDRLWTLGMDEIRARWELLTECMQRRDRTLQRLLPMHEDMRRRVADERREARQRARTMRRMQDEYHRPTMQIIGREVHAQVLGLQTAREKWALPDADVDTTRTTPHCIHHAVTPLSATPHSRTPASPCKPSAYSRLPSGPVLSRHL